MGDIRLEASRQEQDPRDCWESMLLCLREFWLHIQLHLLSLVCLRVLGRGGAANTERGTVR